MNNIKRNILAITALASIAIAQASTSLGLLEGYLFEGEEEIYTVRAEAGSYSLELEGDDMDGDLDAYVYDSRGRLLGKDELEDNIPIVDFTVRRGQTITIKVKNYGIEQGYEGELFRN